MANYYHLKGTSHNEFRIGKRGPALIQVNPNELSIEANQFIGTRVSGRDSILCLAGRTIITNAVANNRHRVFITEGSQSAVGATDGGSYNYSTKTVNLFSSSAFNGTFNDNNGAYSYMGITGNNINHFHRIDRNSNISILQHTISGSRIDKVGVFHEGGNPTSRTGGLILNIIDSDRHTVFTANQVSPNIFRNEILMFPRQASPVITMVAPTGRRVSLTVPQTVSNNYDITLPGSDGTAGQVLTTDGNGNLGWSNSASGALQPEFRSFEVYSTQYITASTSLSLLEFDTTRIPSAFYSVGPTGRVNLVNAGTYSITYNASFEATNTTRSSVECQLYVDGSPYEASKAYSYSRTTNAGDGTATKTVLVTTTIANVPVDVRFKLLSGSGVRNVAYESNMVIRREY